MMKRWLVMDVHNLCWRAFHVMGGLSHREERTGVTYGFLKSVSYLRNELMSDRIVFCFDHPYQRRRKLFPAYKANRRKDASDEELKSYSDMTRQLAKLRLHWLPMIGFKNIFFAEGMEADDLMASLAQNLPKDQEAVLITSDADLWQCLQINVSIYDLNRKRHITRNSFKAEHGYPPREWGLVKAVSGCSSDNVPGVPGVGVVTAEKLVRDELGSQTVAWARIHSRRGQELIRRNLALTRLPFEGCPNVCKRLVDDEIDEKGWMRVCGELGFRSLASRPPRKKLRQQELL